jgi:hypothetical protein
MHSVYVALTLSSMWTFIWRRASTHIIYQRPSTQFPHLTTLLPTSGCVHWCSKTAGAFPTVHQQHRYLASCSLGSAAMTKGGIWVVFEQRALDGSRNRATSNIDDQFKTPLKSNWLSIYVSCIFLFRLSLKKKKKEKIKSNVKVPAG